MGDHFVERARSFAERHFASVVDQAGAPYVGHLERVAQRVESLGGDDVAVAAAWLHDTIEDLAGVDGDTLRNEGFPDDVVRTVESLTRRDDEAYLEFVKRAADDPRAALVKYADLLDNSDPARLDALDAATRNRLVAKYAPAIALIVARSEAST